MREILVAEKTSCRSLSRYTGKHRRIETCAESCKAVHSHMFVYGRNDTNFRQLCYCAQQATPDGTCTETSDYRFDLFKFGEGENFSVIWYTSSMYAL